MVNHQMNLFNLNASSLLHATTVKETNSSHFKFLSLFLNLEFELRMIVQEAKYC
jgi:hypothetical protein